MSQDVDVAVVGAGPCGLLAAAALGRLGHRVVVLERHHSPFGLPRAGHADYEAVRILQGVDAHHEVLEDATPYGLYTWFDGQGDVLFTVDFSGVSESHWFTDYTIYQPTLESGLLRSILDTPGIDIRYGANVRDVSCGQSAVRLALDGPSAAGPSGVKAKYVVAADGANSTVRNLLGIHQADFGFSERWLIVDVEILRRWPGEGVGAQYCDWRRPAFQTPLGRRHHRWEWQLHPSESAEDFTQPATAWNLLALRNIGREDVALVRQQVYTFGAKTALSWRAGRVMLAGDAAHTMPPFMGQGMCSGLRDVANLVWKLDLVLSGAADDRLLDTYETERRPHAEAWTRISITAGEISCVTDPQQAVLRDEKLRSGPAPLPPFPRLEWGMIRNVDHPDAITGTLVLQAPLTVGSKSGLFDDVIPPEFVVLTVDSESHSTTLKHNSSGVLLKHYLLHPAADGEDVGPATDGGAVDTTGAYTAYFARHHVTAVLVRPDRYVFGGAFSLEDVPHLMHSFAVAAASVGMGYER